VIACATTFPSSSAAHPQQTHQPTANEMMQECNQVNGTSLDTIDPSSHRSISFSIDFNISRVEKFIYLIFFLSQTFFLVAHQAEDLYFFSSMLQQHASKYKIG
jgi:hypothetical protein